LPITRIVMMQNLDNIIGRILVVRHFITEDDLQKLTSRAKESKLDLDQVLLQEKVFEKPKLLKILENHFFVSACDFQSRTLDQELAARFPEKIATQHHVFPVEKKNGVIEVAFANPDDKHAQESVQQHFQKDIIRLVALPSDISEVIKKYYQAKEDALKPVTTTAQNGKAAPAAHFHIKQYLKDKLKIKSPVEIVDTIFMAAIDSRASDIHLQPAENELTVRFRLDGILYTVATITKDLAPAVVSRAKILAGMDVAEHRLPQDGRYALSKGTDNLDFRVSLLPSQFGEKIVIRLLRKQTDLFVLNNLQMPDAIKEAYRDAIESPQGFYLVTGPTGSGKTTTLYATLNSLDCESDNIITLEDPIEYNLPGMTQVQIHEEIGMTFASGLRSILRQDPDVILVGEIRDAETVEIACRAALTGHKVFSTLHTNDACQAVTRLLELGTPVFLIAATLKGVIAQRLVRVICPQCKEKYTPNEIELAILGHPEISELYRGKGCEHCNWTGYYGRKAIYEYFKITEDIHRLIIERASPYVIKHAAQKNGMLTMRDFAKLDVLKGITTIGEIQRTILSNQDQEQLCPKCMHIVSFEFSVCPYCHNSLREKCENCGQIADPNWEACPNCGHVFEREWQKRYCKSCLAPVPPEWDVCHYCGGKL
jgi:type IV pilus assembly protein PilB